MPRYRIRLNDPDSNEFRVYRIRAASEAEALEVIERREQRSVDWRMDDDRLADLEEKEAEGIVTGAERGMLHTHRQASRYEVAEVVDLDALVPALADADDAEED